MNIHIAIYIISSVRIYLLSDLELLPGVIRLYRKHGRGGLHPLNHYLLAQLLFCFCVEYFNCWFEEKHRKIFLGIYYCKFSDKNNT